MKKFLLLLVFCTIRLLAQLPTQPKNQVVKDPFFTQNTPPNAPPGEKVQHIHSDTFGVDPLKYDGNPFFSGNVQFSHQGSNLFADVVILYRDQNFIKAIGNVKLQNADGSVITAGEMEYDGNTQRGIARKNVVLTDPKQTIKTETLYYDRVANTAYFNTGGTIYANNSVTYTRNATYFVSSRTIDLTGNIKIDNDQYTLEGGNIKQNQNTNVADIFGPTTIINKKNPANRVYTENGTYNMNTKEVWLNKNSKIFYNGKTLKGDKMYFNQITGFGKANGNVILNDPKERRWIRGGYGEIYEKKDSAMITEKPYAVRAFEKDSMYISAEKFLTFQRADSANRNAKKSFLRAYRKVRMYKTNAQARSDSLSFNETDGILHFDKKPILWSGFKQVTGDRIEVYFDTENENIDSLKVIGNAFAISKVDSLNNKDEFHQIKGRLMTVYYTNNEVKLAQSLGNAQAISYAESQNQKTKALERIGVALSTCGTIEAAFEARRMEIVSCNIGANTDIYPMSKITHKDRFFPDFNWNTKDRPQRWQDIFIDSPNYPEAVYISDDSMYQKAQEAIEAEKKKNQPKTPVRVKK